jgi:hypothetical protein
MSILGFLGSVSRDMRYALRGLLRRPSFTVAAVLTLALGIGATTAIFSVVYSVLIKPLPYPSSDELVRIRYSSATLNTNDLYSSPTQYFTYRAEGRTLAELGMWGDGGHTLTTPDGTERIRSISVTHGLLQALGVQPVRGRWFTEEEHGPAAEGADPIIVSYAFAQKRFGGDAAALGRDLLVNGRQAQIVGVMPAAFRFLDLSPPFDIIVAVRLDAARSSIGGFGFQALARLKPGVTPAEARADIERMLPIWLDAWPMSQGFSVSREAIANWRITPIVLPLKDDMVGGIASALWVLMGAIGAVLLIACANIANLMLVRADARRPELACVRRSAPCRHASPGSCSSRASSSAPSEARWACCSPTEGSSFSLQPARATCRGSRKSPCTRPCLRSPLSSRSRRHSRSARSRRSSTRCPATCPRSAACAARARAASAARHAARWSSCRWRSRSCSS